MIQTAQALIGAEAVKLRRTLAIWMIVVAPILAIVMELASVLDLDFTPAGESSVVWRQLLKIGWTVWLLLISPMLISFEAASLANLENGGKHWKQLFACPISRWSVYAVKLLFCGLLVGVSFMIVLFGFVGGADLQQRSRIAFRLSDSLDGTCEHGSQSILGILAGDRRSELAELAVFRNHNTSRYRLCRSDIGLHAAPRKFRFVASVDLGI